MYKESKPPKEGGGKKKGVAKESDAQEVKNLENDIPVNEVAGATKKKGAAAKTGGGDKEMTAKELKAEGKKLKQQARDKKKADRKSARATKKSDRKTNKSKKLQDKIDLQTLKGEQKAKAGKPLSAKAKKARVEKLKAKKEKLDGAAKKKGAAGFNSHTSDTHKHPHSEGVGRMGFTQNFGAARQNSYSQGAAKVASIMSFGASKKKGAADHEPGHPKPKSGEIQRDDSGKIPTTALNEVVLKPKTNVAHQIYTGDDYTSKKPDITVTAPGDKKSQQVSGGYNQIKMARKFNQGSPLSNQTMSYNSNNMKNFSSGNPANQKQRASMITDFSNFMAEPTSSPRAVTNKLNELKSGPTGELISDIRFYGGGGKKKHAKKEKY